MVNFINYRLRRKRFSSLSRSVIYFASSSPYFFLFFGGNCENKQQDSATRATENIVEQRCVVYLLSLAY